MVNAIMLNVVASTQTQITTICPSQTDAISLFTIIYTGTTLLSKMTFSIMTLSKMTLSKMTLSKMTLSIMTFNIIINKMQYSAKWVSVVMLSIIYSEYAE
jgi:hypothetical protein